MKRCARCGCLGLFNKLTTAGYCADCQRAVDKEAKLKAADRARAEELLRREREKQRTHFPSVEELIRTKLKAPLNEDGTVAVPASIEGIQLAYKYEKEKIYIPDDVTADLTTIDPGDRVRLELEPQNPYDSESVAVHIGPDKVGYLYKGRIRDMVRDFRRAELPIWAHVSGIDDEERVIFLYVAFYRNRKKQEV